MKSSDEEDDNLDCQSQYEEFTLLEACMAGDIEAVQNILEDNPSEYELNERDKTGKTPLSYACVGGNGPIVEMLSEISGLDVNIGDKEGNTPLIFAVQAGNFYFNKCGLYDDTEDTEHRNRLKARLLLHQKGVPDIYDIDLAIINKEGFKEIVKLLLREFRKIKVDTRNKAGFTALMKAALQGRTSCVKLLLNAGANPKLRDHGRKLCAEEWARFTGRKDCADEIAKFTKTKRFLFNPLITKQLQDRSSSEPDLTVVDSKPKEYVGPQRQKSKSVKRRIKKMIQGNSNSSRLSDQQGNPFAIVARCVSTPVLPGGISPSNSPPVLKRPVSYDSIPRVEVTSPAEFLETYA